MDQKFIQNYAQGGKYSIVVGFKNWESISLPEVEASFKIHFLTQRTRSTALRKSSIHFNFLLHHDFVFLPFESL